MKQELPKLSQTQLALIKAGYDRSGPTGALDASIDKDTDDVSENLLAMREFYGEEALAKMTPEEFYGNYKKIAAGVYFWGSLALIDQRASHHNLFHKSI